MKEKLKTVARMVSERKFVISNINTRFKDIETSKKLCENLYTGNGSAAMDLMFQSEILAFIFSCGTIFLRKSRHHATNVTLTVDEFDSLLEETTDRYNIMMMRDDEPIVTKNDTLYPRKEFLNSLRENDKFEGNVGTFIRVTENPDDDNYSTHTFSRD